MSRSSGGDEYRELDAVYVLDNILYGKTLGAKAAQDIPAGAAAIGDHNEVFTRAYPVKFELDPHEIHRAGSSPEVQLMLSGSCHDQRR